MTKATPWQCTDIIFKKTTIRPLVGLILGSGLGSIGEQIIDPVTFPYAMLPGFPVSHVEGHKSQLILGYLKGVAVACLQGRAHFYEGTSPDASKTMIRTLKCLGCHTVVMTNAAGYLHTDMEPGNLLLITDHINFQGTNPLIGLNDDEFGSRFFPMTNAYDNDYQQLVLKIAQQLNIPLKIGTYIGVTGPMFETPAEIKVFSKLGADAVGMSTVGEVIVARHCGLKVMAISAITNLAAGLSDHELSHDESLHFGSIAASNLQRLLMKFLEQISHDH